jgi:hypothetical protein
MRKHTLANPRWMVQFCALAGVADLHLEGDGIAGKWSVTGVELRSTDQLAVEFANWPSAPESIIKFTRKYGPLDDRRTLKSDLTGAIFQFSLENWRGRQVQFREEWDSYVEKGRADREFTQVAPGEGFVRTRDGLSYRATTLWRLLIFGLGSVPSERLRVCARPECPHPYFVARHLKQQYCNDSCAAWGQRQWKLRWWAEHGKDWRNRNATKRSRNKGAMRRVTT